MSLVSFHYIFLAYFIVFLSFKKLNYMFLISVIKTLQILGSRKLFVSHLMLNTYVDMHYYGYVRQIRKFSLHVTLVTF